MISTEGIIEFLRQSRKEKMAALTLCGLMRDSIPEAVERLEEMLPTLKEMKEKSNPQRYRRNKAERLNIDHEIVSLIADMAEEWLPWLKKVTEISEPPPMAEIPNPT